MRDLFLVWLWQLVLLGGFVLSRRVRRLEKFARPPLYHQMGALRESVLRMHESSVFYAKRHGRRLQEIEGLTAEMVKEMRLLAKQADELSEAVVRLGRRVGSGGRRRTGRTQDDPRAEGTVA
jgi:hypothetical protein